MPASLSITSLELPSISLLTVAEGCTYRLSLCRFTGGQPVAGAQETLRAPRSQIEEIVRGILQDGMAEGAVQHDLDPEADAAFIREVLTSQADEGETTEVARLAGAVRARTWYDRQGMGSR